MRKLFLLLPALVLSLFANAKEIEISSSTSNIIHSTIAASTTSDGDVIVLTDAGPYVNSKANSDDYTKIAKNVTIKAADGIQPVIKFEVPIQARDGKSGKFIGIKFDGSSLQYDQFIFVKDDDLSNNELEFEDCEFYNFSKYIVNVRNNTKANSLVFKNCKFYNNSTNRGILNQGNIGRLELDGCEVSNFIKEFIHGYSGTSHVDECVVNDCYFHDNSRSSIMFVASTVDGTQTCDQLTVTNSTFTNINASGEYESVIDIRPYGTAVTDAIQVLVDHCTFYNNTVKNSDHANIRTAYLSDVTVSNCIFYYPSEYATRATYCTGGGNINNCLTYNYTAEGTKGHAYGATVNAASIVADPLFDDLVNNQYTFAGDWTTMSLSPARGAATDGSDLGDPRWYSDEVLPSVDFASPYVLDGLHAKLNGRIALDEDNFLKQNNNDDPTQHGTATWKINATKSCYVSVTPNIKGGSGHHYQIAIYDEDNNLICDPLAENDSWDSDITPNFGTILIPAAGDYKIILSNLMNNSGATLRNITLSYVGGDIQAMPGITNINDAWFSANGTRANGKISFPGSTIQEGWVKWNVSFANTGNYNVTLNVNSNNCKNYTVALVDANDANVVTPLTLNDCSTKGTPVALAMGAMEVPAGNYILKVTNATQNSDAELISVQFAYTGGGIIDIPGSIALNEAILSERAFVDGDGLHFVDADHLWLMSEGYAKWNIHVAADGMYKFTANCNTDGESYSNLTIKVLKGGEEKYSYTPQYTYTGEKTINSPEWFLEAGDYELKLSNPKNNSNGHLVSLSAAAVEGILIVDEMATDMQNIIDLNGQSRKPLLKRSFKGGMYNTVLFPFNNVTDEELTTIFGAGYELLEMTSATLEDNTLNLNFASVDLSQHTYGRPYLIKPTQDVVNPLFNSHTIYKSTSHLTVTGTAADFIGSFIKGEVPAGEDNLFLGPDNLLYFSQTATPIKGTRAYFRVKGVANPAQAIKRARIVTGGQVATEINLVNESAKIGKSAKIIENGQLVIIRDGIRYNVMGAMIK